MRAMVLRAPGPAATAPLVAEERDDPSIGPGDLLLRVTACGVCRTDLQICEGDLAARRLPIVPGHQAVGVVEALGERVEGWRVGDRAGVTWLAGVDGTCRFCRSGRENLCEAATFTGWDRDGGYAERLAVRADVAVPLPACLRATSPRRRSCAAASSGSARSGSPAWARRQRGRVSGCTGSAPPRARPSRSRGAWGVDVFVADRSPSSRERALELGAAWAGGIDEPTPVRLDAAVTFAPVGSVVAAALRNLDRGGTVAINAIHLDRVPELPYDDLWWERSIRSVANVTREDAREFLALAARIGLATDIETHPLADANVALARLAAGQVAGTAVLVVDAAADRP